MGKVEKTGFERNSTTFVTPAFCAAWKSPPKMVAWNWNCKIRSQGCFFVSPRSGKLKKRILNAIGRPSSTRLFPLLGKAHTKWWHETEIVKFDLTAVFFVWPRWEKLKKRVLNAIGRRSSTRLFPLLGKAHPKWWHETEILNSIPRVFFRFPPMGKLNKMRFERNWTTFVNPAFSAAWKSPPKMVAWNRNCKIRSQGCFFASPRWRKLKKRVLYAIGRPSSTRLLPLLGKAHPKWWHETEIVKFVPNAVFSLRPDGKSRKNAFWTQLDDVRQTGFLPCLEKPTQNGGMKPTSWYSILRVFFRFAPMGKVEKTRFERNWTTFVNPAFCPAWKSPLKMVVWNRPRGIRPKGVVLFRPDGESRKNAFWTQLDDVRQPGFLPCLEKPTRNGGMKPTSWNSILRVFFRFAPIGKVEKARFERNWKTFVNPAFCPAWKSPLKMVVWNRPRRIRSQGCCFVSPRWGKSKKRVLNAIGRRSSTRPFALLGSAHSKWWYETDLVELDPKGVFSFRPDGESRKSAFWTQLDDVRQPGFLPCLEAPTQNGGMKPTSWSSILRVFFRFAPMGKVEKARFERNWTTFVTPAFCPAWKRPLKMVVWNRPRGVRS